MKVKTAKGTWKAGTDVAIFVGLGDKPHESPRSPNRVRTRPAAQDGGLELELPGPAGMRIQPGQALLAVGTAPDGSPRQRTVFAKV
jgi:hypothetical protein